MFLKNLIICCYIKRAKVKVTTLNWVWMLSIILLSSEIDLLLNKKKCKNEKWNTFTQIYILDSLRNKLIFDIWFTELCKTFGTCDDKCTCFVTKDKVSNLNLSFSHVSMGK